MTSPSGFEAGHRNPHQASPDAVGRGQTREERATSYFDVLRSMTSDPEILSAVASVEAECSADLRSRLAAAEARATQESAAFHLERVRAEGAIAELARLRSGIQALADEWEAHWPAMLAFDRRWTREDAAAALAASLRSLLGEPNTTGETP